MQLPPGFTLHILEEAGSTNDICLALADAGAPDGTVVFTDQQTAGRGRQGREWFSRSGSSLTFSLLLRLSTEEMGMLSRFSLLGCSALVDVLAQDYQLQGLIKWPNDVIVHGKKICGVLMEALWQGDALQAVILGMGVNIARDAYPPDVDLRYPATSIEAEVGFAPQPLELLEKLLIMLDQTRKSLVTDNFIRVKNAQLAFRGEWVMLEENTGAPQRVRLLEIDQDGGLWVEAEDGSRSKVYAGELSDGSSVS
jgi:BirA family biotin operon repressor/biotin-[acetyl-CoA-carboxylase] ligase